MEYSEVVRLSEYRRVKKSLLIILVLLTLIINGCSSTYVRIPRENIQSNIPNYVREQILDLYSDDPVKRAYAAIELGNMWTSAIPAVPFLIQTLADKTPLRKNTVDHNKAVDTGSSILIPIRESTDTSPGEEAEKALKTITGEDFGKDTAKWQEWWEKNRRGGSISPAYTHEFR